MKSFLRSFSSLPLNHSRKVVVIYKRKYVHEVLVNCLFKLAQEKVWLDELTVRIERTFQREGSPYLACNERNAFFFLWKNLKNIMHGYVKMFVMR